MYTLLIYTCIVQVPLVSPSFIIHVKSRIISELLVVTFSPVAVNYLVSDPCSLCPLCVFSHQMKDGCEMKVTGDNVYSTVILSTQVVIMVAVSRNSHFHRSL
jgi:hypothetical protein